MQQNPLDNPFTAIDGFDEVKLFSMECLWENKHKMRMLIQCFDVLQNTEDLFQ